MDANSNLGAMLHSNVVSTDVSSGIFESFVGICNDLELDLTDLALTIIPKVIPNVKDSKTVKSLTVFNKLIKDVKQRGLLLPEVIRAIIIESKKNEALDQALSQTLNVILSSYNPVERVMVATSINHIIKLIEKE